MHLVCRDCPWLHKAWQLAPSRRPASRVAYRCSYVARTRPAKVGAHRVEVGPRSYDWAIQFRQPGTYRLQSVRLFGTSQVRTSPSTKPEPDPRLTLVYGEATRGWTLQSSVLDEIRTRTGILLSAATVASAFLGAADLTKHAKFDALTWAAVGAFSVVVLLCIRILWPSGGWCFAHDSEKLLDEYVEKGKSLDEMHRDLARAADGHWKDNDEKIKSMFSWFRWASLFMGVTTVLWLIDLN